MEINTEEEYKLNPPRVLVCYDIPDEEEDFFPVNTIENLKQTPFFFVSITKNKTLNAKLEGSNFKNLLKKDKLKIKAKPSNYYVYVWSLKTQKGIIKCKYTIVDKKTITLYLYSNNNRCVLNIGIHPADIEKELGTAVLATATATAIGSNPIENKKSYFYYDTNGNFNFPKRQNDTAKNLDIKDLNLSDTADDNQQSKDYSGQTTTKMTCNVYVYRFMKTEYNHEMSMGFTTIQQIGRPAKLIQNYANFIDKIKSDDYRFSATRKFKKVISRGQINTIKEYYNVLYQEKIGKSVSQTITSKITKKEDVQFITFKIFPSIDSYDILITDINDPNIHMHLTEFDKAINFYYQIQIFKGFKRKHAVGKSKTGGAGEMGGHVGAICIHEGTVYKKYDIDKKQEKKEERALQGLIKEKGEKEEKEGGKIEINREADRELLFYWRIHHLCLQFSKNASIKEKYKHIFNLYNHSSLPLLRDPNKIELTINCPGGKLPNFNKGYELGNMLKIEKDGAFELPSDNENYGILDFKIGAYTKNIVDKYLKSKITYEENDLEGGGSSLFGNLAIYGQLVLDANSTSAHYGFRCEGLGSPIMPLFFGYKIETDKSYNGGDTDIFYKAVEKYSKYINESYINVKVSMEDKEKKIAYFKPKIDYLYVLNKPVIYNTLDVIYKDLYTYFSDNDNISTLDTDILAHFLHINPFNMDNTSIHEFVLDKKEKMINRPLYSLPPIVTICMILRKIPEASLESYWEKLYLFSKELFIDQYDDYIKEKEPLANNAGYRTYFCFVGSSIMIRYKYFREDVQKEKGEIRRENIDENSIKFFLSDFGHPFMFDKEFGKNISSKDEQSKTVSEMDFLFRNFIFGGLGFLFINYLALIANGYNPTDADKKNMATVAKYLKELIKYVLYGRPPNAEEQEPSEEFKPYFEPQNRLETIFKIIQPTVDEYIEHVNDKNRLFYNDSVYEMKCNLIKKATTHTFSN